MRVAAPDFRTFLTLAALAGTAIVGPATTAATPAVPVELVTADPG